MVHYHEAMCHVGTLVHYLQRQGHSEGLNKQNMNISTISSKLPLNLHPNWLQSRSRSEQRVEMSMFIQMISSKLTNILLPNLVLWCIIMSWTMCKRLVCCFQGQGQSSGSYDQNMTVSTISSELLILLLPNLVWWCFINEPDCLPKRLIFCPQVEGHSEGSYNWNMTF